MAVMSECEAFLYTDLNSPGDAGIGGFGLCPVDTKGGPYVRSGQSSAGQPA